LRIYQRTDSHLFCGHWNDSPVEIGLLTRILRQVPSHEQNHYHEYYLVLEGNAALTVEGETVPLVAGSLVMVEPGERHHVSWVDPDLGVRWAIIKERSEPDSKHVDSECGG
jgi:quercetin dioxygenase-like cupin family protein